MVKKIRTIRAFFAPFGEKVTILFKKVGKFIDKKPFTSFFAVCAVVLILLLLGSFFAKKPAEISKEEKVKEVAVYRNSQNPTLTFSGRVEKTGIIDIVALSPGIVQKIAVGEGKEVAKGALLVSLGNNYQGASIPSLSRQMASLQYAHVKDTYDTQKEVIAKSKEAASKSDENADKLRSLANDSIKDTESLVDLNNSILSSLKQSLTQLEQNNGGGQNDALILSTKAQMSQFQSVNAQLSSSLRASRYQSDESNPPAKLSDLSREIAMRQLDMQEKALQLGLEVSKLQLSIASVSESLFFPTAPFSGVIEKVHVVEGQMVNPGNPLVTLHGEQSVKVVVLVPFEVAQSVSRLSPSILTIGEYSYESVPYYVSSEAVEGQSYALYYSLDESLQQQLTNKSFIEVSIPLGKKELSKTYPLVPLDALYQGQNESYVYVIENGRAKSKKVRLGSVFGRFVEVISGISHRDVIISSRTVVAEEKVKEAKL